MCIRDRVLKRELLWLPFFGWALALLRPIAINRESGTSAVKQVIRQGVKHLRQGQWVLIFPEGTRTSPGVRKRYGVGGAVLATHSQYPVLPVALNAGEFWPRRGFLKYPGTVQVVFGPLIESAGHSAQELNQKVEDWIEGTKMCIRDSSDPRRVGARLGSVAERHGDHPIHLFPAGRRLGLQTGHR